MGNNYILTGCLWTDLDFGGLWETVFNHMLDFIGCAENRYT